MQRGKHDKQKGKEKGMKKLDKKKKTMTGERRDFNQGR